VASPPFAVTSQVLGRLMAPGSRLVRADLVLQRGAARRWAAGRAPGAGRWARDYAVGVGRPVPRRAFTPNPPVDCATLVVTRRA
jgi:23S rRNA (adenine-N6)-dimethyltransferase